MRAPAFWARPGSPLAVVLAPLGALYGAVAARRMARRGASAPVPVVCVGNFVAGGAGKTPTALAVAALLARDLRRPVFLTRGYGGSLRAPTLVDLARHAPSETGDEARLLAAAFPTVVSPDRPAGARLAGGQGDVIVMDDGLQNPSLAKDASLAVVDAGAGLGNGLCLPAGPLRAPLAAQARQVDAVVLVGEGVVPAVERLGLPLLRARLRPDEAAAARLKGRKALAFAGIGRPEKFFETLREAGAELAATRSFADHKPYDLSTLEALRREAGSLGATLVTTEKDMARMRGALPPEALEGIDTLPVTLAFDDERALLALLRRKLGVRPSA
ncbi:tetraacyldisaccharide 4'-kinase [Alsobacter sp. SYSU M60028]|uniref:Tetraacyldisaccharide 4'-kinase n=1 Tax=Alsobacter ponti TaxID=2962936 RepID=A0ABT1LCJ3_9HYPH|nr:tetraacyldisaccharide 4'-kinase [Alsobacter ponti]MCP8939220.1 tetraacyldisaccharide 4'-kinase [Alsobacter ponti]